MDDARRVGRREPRGNLHGGIEHLAQRTSAACQEPTWMMAAAKYLVEELGADVNAVDHDGNTAMHNAAARGDVEMILYLGSKGRTRKPSTARGRRRRTWRTGRCSGFSRGRRRWRCWRSWAR